MPEMHEYVPDRTGCMARIPNPDAPFNSIYCGYPKDSPYHIKEGTTMPEMHPHHVHLLAVAIHQTAQDHGFWDKERNLGEMLMLITSELAEALEEHRDGRPAVWFQHDTKCILMVALTKDRYDPGIKEVMLTPKGGVLWDMTCECHPKPEGAAVEIVDAIIRCLDTGFMQVESTPYTIDDLMRMKMAYNDQREHMHGKAY